MNELINQLNILAFAIAPIFYKILFMSLSAILVGTIIMLVRRFFDKKIPPVWKYILWGMVFIALVLPYRLEANFALTQNISQVEEISFREEFDDVSKLAPTEDMTEQEVIEWKHERSEIMWKSILFDVVFPLTWFFGMIFVGIFIISSKIYLTHNIKKHSLNSENFDNILAECKDKLHITGDIKIVVQDYCQSPALMGLIKPKILLPNYTGDMSEENLYYIVLHELGHYKRKDMLINYILLTLQAIYWFNPLVWILFKFIREDMELLNDSFVLNNIDNNQTNNYARSLVEILGLSHNVSLMPKLLCMIDSKKNVERRISMIKLGETFKKHRIIIAVICLAIICIVSALFLTHKKVVSAPEAVKLLVDSIDYQENQISFTIPKEYPETDDWNILIAGRTETNGVGMSTHFFEKENEDKTWEKGKIYNINIKDDSLTDLTLNASLEGTQQKIDLLEAFEMVNYDYKKDTNTDNLSGTNKQYTINTDSPNGDVQLSINNTTEFTWFGDINEGFAYLEKATNQLHFGIITKIGHPNQDEIDGVLGSIAGAEVTFDYDIKTQQILNTEHKAGASSEKLTINVTDEELATVAETLLQYIYEESNTQNSDVILPVENTTIIFGINEKLLFQTIEPENVYAVMSGTVINAEFKGEWGQQIQIMQDDGNIAVYSHLSSFQVSDKDKVNAGDVIGTTGATGKATTIQCGFTLIKGEIYNLKNSLTVDELKEYLDVELDDAYAKSTTGNMALDAELPYLVYANKNYCVMNLWHSGVIVYDFNKEKIIDRIRFEQLTDVGFKYPNPFVSSDGKTIYFQEDSPSLQEPNTHSYSLQDKKLVKANDDFDKVIHQGKMHFKVIPDESLANKIGGNLANKIDGYTYSSIAIEFDDTLVLSRLKDGDIFLDNIEIVLWEDKTRSPKIFDLLNP